MSVAHHKRAAWLRRAPTVALLALAVLLPPAAAETQVVREGGGSIEVEMIGAPPPEGSLILDWTRDAARAVTAYYGRFPVPRVALRVRARGRRPVGFGMMHPGFPPTIRIDVAPHASREHFARDWTLTHEMVHLGFPDVKGRHRWIEEGLATYVEPLARARAGALSEEEVWREMARGLPKGISGGGLDDDPSWGRTYWGGALFWLLADVEVRERTSGRRGLDDVLRAIVAEGGTAAESWTLERVLATSDRAAGVAVFVPLHRRLAHAPTDVDLPDLWRRLGVRVETSGAVSLDAQAPLAAIRKAIVWGRGRTWSADRCE